MSNVDYYEKVRQKMSTGAIATPKYKKVLEFLKIIWNEEEAKLVSNFEGVGKLESSRKLAIKAGIDKAKAKEMLNRLAARGTIFKLGNSFGLLPLVPGIVELYYLSQKDSQEIFKKAAPLLEDIRDNVLPGVLISQKEKLFLPKLPYDAKEKLIKIEKPVGTGSQILTGELVEDMINKTDYYVKFPCQCRMIGDYAENPCKVAPKDVGCFVTGSVARLFASMGFGEEMTKEEAIEYLRKAEKAGLVHNGANVAGSMSNMFICNCCTCHCGVLKSQAVDKIGAVGKSNFEPVFDDNLCTKCETCMKKCPVGAIYHQWPIKEDSSDEKMIFRPDYCLGCGLCAINCPKNAIKMERVRNVIPTLKVPIGLPGAEFL